jgi:GTPase SAR1 family protein
LRIIFFIGTAGSGKSLLTASFAKWLGLQKQNVAILNLDPGVLTLPYTPDIDIRDSIDIEKLMDEYGLGPNGALVVAADLIADDASRIGSELEDLQQDVVLVDTPGQMELFAFRASGPYIVNEISKDPKALIYLFDSVFSSTPLNYVSNLFLSAAVFNRFLIPQVYILSKCDLLRSEVVKKVIDWSSNPEKIEEAVEAELEGARRLLSRDLIHAVNRLGLRIPLIPVSAKTNEGFIVLNMVLERILAGGEPYTY